MNDPIRGLERFERSIHNKLLYERKDIQRPPIKFMIQRQPAPLHIPNDALLELNSEFQELATYFSFTKNLISSALSNVTIPKHLNFHRDDQTFMHRLIDDPDVTCKPADKNLGLVLVDTKWYNEELTKMLSDTVTYIKFGDRSKPILPQVNALKANLSKQLKVLAEKYTSTLKEWYGDIQGDAMANFLQHGITQKDIAIPEIYLLIKVHKPKGLCGRPIVPCRKWITTPASVLVDYLLQDCLKGTKIEWIVKDTKTFVNELEKTHCPRDDGSLITADISSLYTNIDTIMGIKQVKEFLTQLQIDPWRINMIIDLLTFVMKNSYLSFKGQIYKQIDGTAMGTACAPTYANIVVYMLERHVIINFGKDIALYRRYLDDIFVSIIKSRVIEFQQIMNELHPKLKFEFTQHDTEAAFLDLSISKGTRFESDGRFDLSVHQKSMNLYLYIPFNSYHTESTKRSFIQTELTRYIRNSSSMESYLILRALFWSRLRDRGYPTHFLTPVFNSIWYIDRPFFLLPADELINSPLRKIYTPKSACLLKRIARAEEAARFTSSDTTVAAKQPPVFIIPFTPLSSSILTRSILLKQWDTISRLLKLPNPIIAYQSCASIMVRIVHQKDRRIKEVRDKECAPTQTKQSQLSFIRLIKEK